MPDFPDLDAVPEPQRTRLREALEGKLGLGDGWTFREIVPGARRQDGAPNVFRAVLDHADGRRLPFPPPETASRRAGLGLRRVLPLDRVRETLVIPRRLVLPEQTGVLARLCDAEPGWLDWALARLGVPGGLGTLLAPAVSEPIPALWTPHSPWRRSFRTDPARAVGVPTLVP